MGLPTSDLAVIIPAYKARFFADALRSLRDQTCRDFTVYVGDDASPENLQAIVDAFSTDLAIRYHRFPSNLGSRSLVGQWARCVELAQNERWLWLFSDDDLASPRCVEAFRDVAGRFPSEVYRFNTHVIDGCGAEKSPSLPSPDFESSERMALHLLYWKRGNSMPDHIFSREVYERCGGFVDTPYAQGADWATSILFSQARGMRVVQDGLISWRQSGSNVSSIAATKRNEIMNGHYRFIDWILDHFRYLRAAPRDGVSYEDISAAALYNLNAVIIDHYRGLSPAQYRYYVEFVRTRFGLSAVRSVRELARIVYKTSVRPRSAEKRAA